MWFWIVIAVTIAWAVLWLTGAPALAVWLLALAWMAVVNIWILRPHKYPPRSRGGPRED